MLLYDLSHTSHSQARTGVQRVALELRRALQQQTSLQEVTHDPHQSVWRPLAKWELDAIERPPVAGKKRGSYWPLSAQLSGALKRRFSNASTASLLPREISAFFTPEIFTQRTGHHLTQLFDHLRCPKIALFHDAISLRRPDLTPPGTVGRFPSYMAELLMFDGVLAVSEDSKKSLEDYWAWADWKPTPPVRVLPLGVDHLTPPKSEEKPTRPDSTPPMILCVGSIEGRKNHLTLLEACDALWQKGVSFELRLIGGLQRESGKQAIAKIKSLQNAGRPIRYDGWLNDAAVQQAYLECRFTVYPSLMEGFGFPIWESLLHGRPCVCSNFGATAEIAQGGGCLAIDTRSASEMAQAIQDLLQQNEKLNKLTNEAADRAPPFWADAASALLEWIKQLSKAS